MTKDELIKLLNGHEWNNVEFKRAQRGVPESAYVFQILAAAGWC